MDGPHAASNARSVCCTRCFRVFAHLMSHTALVLGAGASRPYRFPTATELRHLLLKGPVGLPADLTGLFKSHQSMSQLGYPLFYDVLDVTLNPWRGPVIKLIQE